jgi:hypothetical protein
MMSNRAIWSHGLAVAALALAMPTVSNPAEEPAPLAYSSLSGTWKGNASALQRGNCSTNHSGRQDWVARFLLEATPDGRFAAAITLQTRKGKSQTSLKGQFGPGSAVTATAPARADCGSRMRDYVIEYVGRVVDKKGRLEMELEATDPTCDDENRCVFKRVYSVKKSED